MGDRFNYAGPAASLLANLTNKCFLTDIPMKKIEPELDYSQHLALSFTGTPQLSSGSSVSSVSSLSGSDVVSRLSVSKLIFIHCVSSFIGRMQH